MKYDRGRKTFNLYEPQYLSDINLDISCVTIRDAASAQHSDQQKLWKTILKS